MPKVNIGWDSYKPYSFDIPKTPKDQEILGYDIKEKTNQFWTPSPIMNISKMSVRDADAYIEKELERRTNGIFFMNNGEPTYITGMHYEHLVYNRFPKFETTDKRPAYYDSQREDFYFRQLLMTNDSTFGGIWIKGRRYGLTAQEITNQIYIATHQFDRGCFIMSQKEDVAKKTLFKPILYVLKNRPAFAKYKYYAPNGQEPETKLEFDNKKTNDDSLQLGSVIIYLPTLEYAVDGETTHYLTADEYLKWKISLSSWWGVTKETLKVGTGKRGIANLTSTVGDNDKISGKTVEDGHKLWIGSDATKVDSLGRTDSGLWKWFIPAYKAMEGFVDKHGFPLKDQCIDYIMGERSKHEEGSPEWLGEVRRYPIFEDEVWNTVQTAKVFDTVRINTRLNQIKSLPNEELGLIKGNIEVNGHTQKRIFIPSSEGRWLLNGLPHPKSTNRATRTSNGWELPDDREYALGVDPLRYTLTKGTHLSKTSAVILKKQKFDWDNMTDIVIPDFKIAAVYNERLETKELTYEDVVNGAMFFSAKINPERQVNNFTEDFAIPKGFLPMLTRSHYDNQIGYWTTKATTDDGLSNIQTLFLRRPRKSTDEAEQELDHLFLCNYEKLLEQLRDFDTSNTTKSDIVMALIMAFFEFIQMSTIRKPSLNLAVQNAMRELFGQGV